MKRIGIIVAVVSVVSVLGAGAANALSADVQVQPANNPVKDVYDSSFEGSFWQPAANTVQVDVRNGSVYQPAAGLDTIQTLSKVEGIPLQ